MLTPTLLFPNRQGHLRPFQKLWILNPTPSGVKEKAGIIEAYAQDDPRLGPIKNASQAALNLPYYINRVLPKFSKIQLCICGKDCE
jgi:hypothetical protein